MFDYDNKLYDLGEYFKQGPIQQFKMKGNVATFAQNAFDWLTAQSGNFDFSKPTAFLVFETLFYRIFTNAYPCIMDLATSAELISIEDAQTFLTEEQYQYLSIMHEAIKFQFSYWIQKKDAVKAHYSTANKEHSVELFEEDGSPIKQSESYFAPWFIADDEPAFWSEMNSIAEKAHNIYPTGELANRFMFISDIQLIYGVSDERTVYNPDNERLIKYLDIRENFIQNCFNDEFKDVLPFQNDDCYGWIDGLPHIFWTKRPVARAGSIEELMEEGCETFLDKITMFPAFVFASFNLPAALLREAVISNRQSQIIKQKKQELEETNKQLLKAQEEKQLTIQDFSHRYKKTNASNLQKIADALLDTGQEELMQHGRTLMLEYVSKMTLKKEVELLQLRFEDKIETLREKLHNSMFSDKSLIKPSTLRLLLGEAFKRCLITMFYDEEDGAYMLDGFSAEHGFSKDLFQVCMQFEKEVLFKENGDVISWITENMLRFQCSISSSWESLLFQKDDYAAIALIDLLVELTENAFKYADKSKEIEMRFEETKDCLLIVSRNFTAEEIRKKRNGGVGLKASGSIFSVLNKEDCIETNVIQTNQTPDGCFEIIVTLSKRIFLI